MTDHAPDPGRHIEGETLCVCRKRYRTCVSERLTAADHRAERLEALLRQVRDKTHRTCGIRSLEDALFTLYAADDLIHQSRLLEEQP